MKSIPGKLIGLVVLLFGILACRPFIAIGWPELIILVIVIAILMGPLMFRLYRALDDYNKWRKDTKKKGK